MELVIGLIIWAIGFAMAMSSPQKYASSPIGMVIATIGIGLLVNPCFEHDKWWGWGAVFFALLYLISTIKAYAIYCRLNAPEEED